MSKKIVVTVCSANHLAQAKGMGDSLLKYNPDYKLIIGLVDKLEGRVPASYCQPHELIEVASLQFPEFEGMYKRYNTLELSCALKSFFLEHAFKKYNPEFVIFMDTDILIFDSFRILEEELKKNSIIISPHITSAFPQDGLRPREKDILKTGMFNAGFFALRNDKTGWAFLNWWKERMIDQGYERPKEGLNADQNWLNFVPLYFENVRIFNHPGHNTAYWNLHERTISKKGDKYFFNEEPLVFFHFSGYSIDHAELVSRHEDRFHFKGNDALKELFQVYHDELIKNDHPKMKTLKCYYQKSSGILKKLGFKK